MEQLMVDFSDRFRAALDAIQESFDNIPEAAFAWVPGPGMNSAETLINHIFGSTRFWVGDVALQDPSNRVRQTEFELQQQSRSELQGKLDELRRYLEQGIPKLSLSDLAEIRPVRDEQSFSVGWALLHALEHMTEHVGHLGMLVQLWQAEKR